MEKQDIIDAIRDHEDPVLSTAEIAEELPIGRRSTLNKLEGLEYADAVESKNIGGRNRIWWLPGTRSSPESTRQIAEADGGPDRDADGLGDVLDGWRPGRGPEERSERRAAARAALEWLRDLETEATRADFIAIRESLPADVGAQNDSTWWEETVRPALNRAVEAGIVTKPHSRAYKWTS